MTGQAATPTAAPELVTAAGEVGNNCIVKVLKCGMSSGGGAGFGGVERGGGSSSFSERPGVGKIGEMPKQQQGSNGSGYTTDGYGMGAMGSR